LGRIAKIRSPDGPWSLSSVALGASPLPTGEGRDEGASQAVILSSEPTTRSRLSYVILYNKYRTRGHTLVFKWNAWNEEHVASHGIEPEEAEEVVLNARSPFPLGQDDGKYLVWGPAASGRLLQVVFVLESDETVFVIHARPLTDKEKKRYRRRAK